MRMSRPHCGGIEEGCLPALASGCPNARKRIANSAKPAMLATFRPTLDE